jgi:hypothetical protein
MKKVMVVGKSEKKGCEAGFETDVLAGIQATSVGILETAMVALRGRPRKAKGKADGAGGAGGAGTL